MDSVGLIMLRQIFRNFSPDHSALCFQAYSGVFSLMAAGYIIHFLPEKFKEVVQGIFIRIPLAAQIVIVSAGSGFLLYQMRINRGHAVYLFQVLETRSQML